MFPRNCVKRVQAGSVVPPLPLPALHLLAPPMRLASAALWHSVQHRVVAHYGMLEEFVTMVTDIIPGLLNPKQRAQLILGLQAQLVLELCRSEPVADPLTIKTHVDRMQTLTPLWGAEATDAEVEFSGSNFLSLIETLQREPEERQHFFQDVFPVEFGQKYDAAIQTLMWQFLSRLEKTLQVPDFQEVASLLSEDPSALEKGVELLSLTPELRSLLEYHSDPILLDQDDAQATLDGDCILSALCLPPVERVVIVSEQTQTGAGSREEPSVKTEDVEMDTDPHVSENERERRKESSAEEHSNDIRPPAITEEQEVEEDGEVAVVRVDDMEPDCGEPVTGGQKEVGDHDSNMETVSETVMVVREDGTLMPLDVLDRRPQNHPGNSRAKAKTMGTTPTVTLERLDISNMAVPPPSRSVRWNKGLKMKKFIELERKAAEREPSGRKSQKTNTKYSRAKSKAVTKMARSESGSQSCRCDKCGKSFSARSSLIRHTQLGRCAPDVKSTRLHTMPHVKKLLFQCSNCERAFRDKYSWSAHQLVCLFASQQRGELVSGETVEGPAVILNDPQPSNTPEPPNMAQSSSPGAPGLQRDSVLQPPSSAEEHGEPILSTDCVTTHLQPGTAEPSSSQCNIQSYEGLTHSDVSANEELSDTKVLANEELSHSDVSANEGLSHEDERIHQCQHCQQAFRSSQTLERHYKSCKSDRPQSTRFRRHRQHCHVCGKYVVGLEKHLRRHSEQGPLTCPNCGETRSCKSRLRSHMTQSCKVRRVSEEEAIQILQMKKRPRCDECGKEFAYKATLKAHKLTHNELCCVECKKVFPDAETLARHVLAHKPVKCTMCDKRFHVIAVLSKHYLDVHGFSGPFACSHCPKRYAAVGALVRHERIHTGELPYRCSQCSRGFNTRSQLDTHERRHSGGKRFLCWECGKTYNTNLFLRKHMERHHSANAKKPHQCPECDHAFWKKTQFARHMKLHHEGLKFPCSLCGKPLCNASSLARHMLVHSEVKPFSCSDPDCGKAYTTSLFLKKHMERHHNPNPKKPHQCPECDQAFWIKSHFAKHMKLHHEGYKFPCSLCGKLLRTGTSLARHLLIHSGEKPFSCSYQDCDKVFRCKKELIIHTRYHTGERPFKCRHCGKGFLQSVHATTHELSHTQERPHVCDICGKTFNRKGTLNRHQHVHTGEKPHKCPDCGESFRRGHHLKSHKQKHHSES